jgi:hypothetical protein
MEGGKLRLENWDDEWDDFSDNIYEKSWFFNRGNHKMASGYEHYPVGGAYWEEECFHYESGYEARYLLYKSL